MKRLLVLLLVTLVTVLIAVPVFAGGIDPVFEDDGLAGPSTPLAEPTGVVSESEAVSPDPMTTDESALTEQPEVTPGTPVRVEMDPVLVGAGVLVLVLAAGGLLSIRRKTRAAEEDATVERALINR